MRFGFSVGGSLQAEKEKSHSSTGLQPSSPPLLSWPALFFSANHSFPFFSQEQLLAELADARPNSSSCVQRCLRFLFLLLTFVSLVLFDLHSHTFANTLEFGVGGTLPRPSLLPYASPPSSSTSFSPSRT